MVWWKMFLIVRKEEGDYTAVVVDPKSNKSRQKWTILGMKLAEISGATNRNV